MAFSVSLGEALHFIKQLRTAVAFGVAKDEGRTGIGRRAGRVEAEMSQEIEQQGLAAALARRSDVQIAEHREDRMQKRSRRPTARSAPAATLLQTGRAVCNALKVIQCNAEKVIHPPACV